MEGHAWPSECTCYDVELINISLSSSGGRSVCAGKQWFNLFNTKTKLLVNVSYDFYACSIENLSCGAKQIQWNYHSRCNML